MRTASVLPGLGAVGLVGSNDAHAAATCAGGCSTTIPQSTDDGSSCLHTHSQRKTNRNTYGLPLQADCATTTEKFAKFWPRKILILFGKPGVSSASAESVAWEYYGVEKLKHWKRGKACEVKESTPV